MILIIDDDEAVRMSLGFLLRKAGYGVKTASSPEEALTLVRQTIFDLILMDMNYSISTDGREGLELLRKVKVFQPETPVILITAWGSIQLAVEGMRNGAYDFLTKPWDNRTLLQRIETVVSLSGDDSESRGKSFDRCGIIGNDPALLELLATVERVAPTDAPVLILGENGSGKELVAKAIHENSRRRKNPLVMVNLGGIAQSLFESEMFGYARGAFTGAVGDRKGRFEMADTGTIFLDEIGDLDMSCQVKLLRVLQQHTFEPLGDSRPKKVDIRVVCATNADLPEMVRKKTFREDLFYRINLITLRLPALRERRGDIPALVAHFMSVTAASYGIEVPEITPEAMDYLTMLSYPGNIRQLRNMVERAVLTGGKRIEKTAFSEQDGAEAEVAPETAVTLVNTERDAIVAALERSGGNLSHAARILGVTRQTLYRRMAAHGMKRGSSSED